MAFSWRALVFALFLSFNLLYSETLTQQTQTFIVRVENEIKPSEFSTVEEWYDSTIKSLSSKLYNSSFDIPTTSQPLETNIFHVYKTVFHGFSAKLTPQQVQELKTRNGILDVLPDRIRYIQTTRSPHFLGLDTARAIDGLIQESDFGSNVIIGLLDTGITPEHESFNDQNMNAIPSRWKGKCVGGENFPKTLCNKKLIGARYFTKSYQNRIGRVRKENGLASARDTIGHGTHTASTAAGRAVANASFVGFAGGIAAGVAQNARIAMYKVCGELGCMDSDILAGFDSAVHDGVDVVSISLGSGPMWYQDDVIAMASFAAMERGIFVSAAVGNFGPDPFSVTNVAPWITTVGASTIDRKFPAYLYLDDGTVITGASLFKNNNGLADRYWPLIYAGNASSNTRSAVYSYACGPNSLNPELIRGKIVICDHGIVTHVTKGVVVKEAGGIGLIVANVASWGETLIADAYLMPALTTTVSGRTKLFAYMRSTQNPMGTMGFGVTQIGVKPASMLASFSSRGPNSISINVMKPDLIAPGVNILAAFPDGISREDHRRTKFAIKSGTSMSCPHVSGIGALLKGARSDWSPAMIRSALMTTAYIRDHDGNALQDEKDLAIANAWAMGAGHVDPNKALHPGLVYDLTADDYLNFLGVSNLTLAQIKVTTKRELNCSEAQDFRPWDLNYPAISVDFNASKPYDLEVVVTRTVTNVGDAIANYSATVNNPTGVIATVTPQKLVFYEKGEKKSYRVKIVVDKSYVPVPSQSEFGQLSWTDGKHQDNSPVIVTWLGVQ